jgi:hypothetical protein
VRERSPRLERDRSLASEIDALADALRDGTLLAEVEAASAALR